MTTPLRRRLRLLRRGFGYTAAVALVLLAMALGLASQALPLAEEHPERIAAWLSERAGQPVAFDRVRTEWTRRGPLLRLDNLRVGAGRGAFVVGDTEMLVSLYAGLLPGHPFSELRLRGVDLTLERHDDGRWRVRGLPGEEQAGDGDPLAALEPLGELQVIGGKLTVVAPALGIDVRVPRIDLRLRVSGEQVYAGLRAWPQLRAGAQPLDAALEFDRHRGDGRLYAGAHGTDLAQWALLLRAAGVEVANGRGDAEAWARLRAHRITEVKLDAALEGVRLRSLTAPARVAAWGDVDARVRWRAIDGGWQLDAARLRIGERARPQTLDGLRVAGGARYGVRARALDADPLLALAALSDRVPAGLRDWLQRTRPQLRLRDIAVSGERGGALRAQARIERFGYRAVGDAPGIDGLAGRLQGDRDGFVFEPDPAARVRFDWPSGFGTVHEVALRGTIAGWRDGAGWQVATPALRIAGTGFGARARGGLRFEGDGSRPRMDLAVRVDDTALPVARGFWVRHQMPASAVNWLDQALLGGHVRDGRAVIAGDLDHWPFLDRDGLFEAVGRLDHARVKFQPDWPATDTLDGEVRFVGNGFRVDGQAQLAGVSVTAVHADIDRYSGGTLTVNAESAADAAQLLALLRQSPLQKTYGDTFAQLSARGPARTTFALRLPLAPGTPPQVDGEVRLDNARLADARWKLAFDQVRGRIAYRGDGVLADALQVRHDGQPGQLALRIGSYVREPRNTVELELDAVLAAGTLLERAPELAWLRPHVSGRSPWTVAIAVPRVPAGRTAPTLLQLRSALVGTALELPAPLRKPAGAALPTTIDTTWPVGEGEVRVTMGSILALRARSSGGRTGVRVRLGSASVDEPPPASGLVVDGRITRLDAIDWIAFTQGDGTGDDPLPLQRIAVTAERLQLLGGVFPDTELVVAPAPGGAIAVRASGPALAGAVLIPAGRGSVSGRWERVHWTAAGAGAPTAAAATASVGPEFDPVRIPALAFDIDDLRINGQRFGDAQVRTRPNATGLHIERLHARHGKQDVAVSGDWNGRGASARTHLVADVASEDFGALLRGLGYGGRIDGGS
ncbi:MAG TPA: YhdP family protein, partial [Lysobacter sp.]|nr:YhdP family protein [Lysobacter sp.]